MSSSYPRWEPSQGPVRCKGCKQPVPPGTDIFIKSKGVYYCSECGIVAENAGDEVKAGGIEEAFIKDLARLPEEAADNSLAIASRYMARQLDQFEVGPREVTQYTKEIRLNLLQLHELYPPAEDGDDTEERRAKLQERRRREQGGM